MLAPTVRHPAATLSFDSCVCAGFGALYVENSMVGHMDVDAVDVSCNMTLLQL